MNRLLQMILEWLRPPRFAKYRPAARLGTRCVEDRLLRRIAWPQTKTTR